MRPVIIEDAVDQVGDPLGRAGKIPPALRQMLKQSSLIPDSTSLFLKHPLDGVKSPFAKNTCWSVNTTHPRFGGKGNKREGFTKS
jgi:hypothetical protein